MRISLYMVCTNYIAKLNSKNIECVNSACVLCLNGQPLIGGSSTEPSRKKQSSRKYSKMTREIFKRKTFAGNKMPTHLNHTEHSDEYQSQFCHFSCFLSFFSFIYLFDLVCKNCSLRRCDVSGMTTESQLNQAYRFAGTLNNSRLFEHFVNFTIIAFICDDCVSNVCVWMGKRRFCSAVIETRAREMETHVWRHNKS